MTHAERTLTSTWRDATSGGFVAEVRGLYDEEAGRYEWIRLGVYGTRKAAEAAARRALGL